MKFNLKRLLRPIPYIFTDKAGRFLAKQFSKKILQEAIAALEIFPDSEAKKELQRLANFSIQRTY